MRTNIRFFDMVHGVSTIFRNNVLVFYELFPTFPHFSPHVLYYITQNKLFQAFSVFFQITKWLQGERLGDR